MIKYLNLKNYINFLINKTYIMCTPLILKWQNKYLIKYGNMPLKHQPIFIIGAPRTGSTILYQTITNELDVLYVDNVTCRFDKTLFFGFWLSNKLFKQKAHNCFKSNHGDTTQCGLHAPSECGSFWYRWLPIDRHFIDHSDIKNEMVDEIRKEITTVINYFDKPIIFKNLNMGQRMRFLKKAFPHAKFIYAKREIMFTAQSILKAKRKLGLKDSTFWSVMPKNIEELKKLQNGYEQTIKQIYYIDKQIFSDKNLFDKNNFLIVDYYELNNYKQLIENLHLFLNVSHRKNFENSKIYLTEKISLELDEIKKLQNEIEILDWSFYDK